MKSLTIDQAVEVLKKGGVVAYPTETFYGLGVLASNPQAIDRLFRIKKREKDKPISILIASVNELQNWASEVGEKAQKLIEAFWPGPLTLVFKACQGVSPELTAKTGKIGLRISSEPNALEMITKLGGALTATSANLSGEKPALTALEVDSQIGTLIDGIVSSKDLNVSKGSTIIDISDKKIQVIREGEIPIEKIWKIIS